MAASDRKSGTLRETDLWRKLSDLVDDIGPRLVILDTLADIFGGNEIVRSEVTQFINMLNGMAIDNDCAVILIAHPSLDGIRSGDGTSGSTGWHNKVRSRLYLERIMVDGCEMDTNSRVLTSKKANYGPIGRQIQLRYSDGVFIVPETTGPTIQKVLADAKAERVFMDLLAKFTAQGRDVSPKPSRTYAPTVFAAHPSAEGVTAKAFAKAMEWLLENGKLSVETFGPPSKSRSKIVIAPSKESEQ